MSDDFEKQTLAGLAGQVGEIPTTIKLLAIALDRTFSEMNHRQEERHDQIVNLLVGHKTNIEKDCGVCKREVMQRISDVNQKVDKLKWITFFSENPKTAGLCLLGILALIGSGIDNILKAFL